MPSQCHMVCKIDLLIALNRKTYFTFWSNSKQNFRIQPHELSFSCHRFCKSSIEKFILRTLLQLRKLKGQARRMAVVACLVVQDMTSMVVGALPQLLPREFAERKELQTSSFALMIHLSPLVEVTQMATVSIGSRPMWTVSEHLISWSKCMTLYWRLVQHFDPNDYSWYSWIISSGFVCTQLWY